MATLSLKDRIAFDSPKIGNISPHIYPELPDLQCGFLHLFNIYMVAFMKIHEPWHLF